MIVAPRPSTAPIIEERPDPRASRIAQLEAELRAVKADRDALVATRESWRAEAREEVLADLERCAAERAARPPSFAGAPGPVASLNDGRSEP